MKFKEWFTLQEMASFTLPTAAQFSIPCNMVQVPGFKFDCIERPVHMIDFRFEGPPPYDPPFNKLGNGSPFIAKLPKSSEYLIYHGWTSKRPEILPEKQAKALGYQTVPDYWFIRAELLDAEGNLIKPALGDITGERKNYFKGEE